jgi:hypothetical protein
VLLGEFPGWQAVGAGVTTDPVPFTVGIRLHRVRSQNRLEIGGIGGADLLQHCAVGFFYREHIICHF